MTRKFFESMTPPAKRFYSRVFNNALLNIMAVQRGYFDTYLHETDDPEVMRRWAEAIPQVVTMIKMEMD
jgi:hypothetical protein